MSNRRLARVATVVEQRLKEIFAAHREKSDDSLSDFTVWEPIWKQVEEITLRSGKRFRSALVFCGAELFDASSEMKAAVVDASAALELLHTYFLIHDDIMDGDETRRGGPSAHVALSMQTGSSKLGTDLAVLCGDLSVALHEHTLATMDIPDDMRSRVAKLFSKMHIQVIHGQALDIMGNADPEEIAFHKTASYTTVGPLAIGAALGSAKVQGIARVKEIGIHMGIAFQLRDDLLGAFGDSNDTGKPVGTDLRRGKRTSLLSEAMKRSDSNQIEAIKKVLGKAEANDSEISRALEAIDSCGARKAIENRINVLGQKSMELLSQEQFEVEGRLFLADLIDCLGSRNT